MGRFRDMAKSVVNRLLGGSEASASTAPRAPAARAPAPEPVVEDANTLARIEAGAQEVKERIDAGEPVVLLDVREPFETAGGIVPGARTIPLGELRERWKELENCNEVVCYCAAGARSLEAARFLREKGLFNATSLEGGVTAWVSLGGALARPGAPA